MTLCLNSLVFAAASGTERTRLKKVSVVLRSLDTQLPLTVRVTSDVYAKADQTPKEICYGYRYAEKKLDKSGHPWRIRQTGLYHRYNFDTSQSTLISISPLPDSRFEQRVAELITSSDGKLAVLANPMVFHHMLISTHLSDIKGYLLYFEEVLGPIVNYSS